MCKLSVIVPVYNTEKYLSKCICSLLEQEYEDIEIILVNDGSTDRSDYICQSYAKQYSKIKYISKKNEGACRARYTGVLLAEGDYLGFVDSDDYLKPDYFSVLMEYADTYNADIVTAGYSINGKVVFDVPSEGLYRGEKLDDIYAKMIFDKHQRRNGVLCSLVTKIIKKNLYLEVLQGKEISIKLWEDLSYLYKILLRAKNIYISDNAGYIYRQNMESISHRYNENMFGDILQSFEYSKFVYGDEDENIQRQISELEAHVLYVELKNMAENAGGYYKFKKLLFSNHVPGFWQNLSRRIDSIEFFTHKEKEIINDIVEKKYWKVYISLRVANLILKIRVKLYNTRVRIKRLFQYE
ncbi:Glycosyltransferase involved in cell wall bisynthesis [Pseudobutyrivibrio sp. UC1225]|uniref:glycosyltransferase n=1 Tax=Pseudobutyrivibrio sp. UC1225 TaxID=1798185 RepID=UPI0008DFE238|nr:glycosyltransferase [Pseudobutyrivibrio sp. UC1225]SFN78599.1 Glycosyltransferase involved in cell wall bisynthesis [Pseudobutyrivibrio sp. UC1225]